MTRRQGIVFHESNHSYWIDGKRAVGVTTALKGIPKDEALKRWAAKLVASYTVDHIAELLQMLDHGGRGPTMQFLAELPNQRRDEAAVRGTQVHAYAERIIKGEEVEVPEALAPYVQSYVQYLDEWEPTTVGEELVVASRTHLYAGRLDSIQDIPGVGRAQVDYKTSGGVYGNYALQIAAYRYAEVYIDADGNERPMIPVDRTFILHLTPEGYQLIPVQAGEDEFRKFLVAKENYINNVQSRKLDKLIGAPMEPPVREFA